MNSVLPQILENKNFPKTITEYIIRTEIEIMSGDALYLLTNIFSEELFKDLIGEKFIEALFKGLDVINSEENFNSFIKMMTKINKTYNIVKGNIFLKVYSNNKNSNILSEALLRLLTKETRNKIVMYDALECLINIMEYTQSSFLYPNDLDGLVNLSISILKDTYTEELRIYILRALYEVTKYDDYYTNSYKKSELVEILDDYKGSENVEADTKELSKRVLDNIKNH
jgi:hypothetical protein